MAKHKNTSQNDIYKQHQLITFSFALFSMQIKKNHFTSAIIYIYRGNIRRYTPITVTQTAPFQTINLNSDLVVSLELIKQVAL